MKSNLKGFAGNLLFALNLFILFVLLFESKLVVPQWLKPVGRMHPMILHFPIVILMLAMVLEFFRFKSTYNAQEFYKSFTSNLLLLGIVSAAVTVIMGLFLSKEEGYSGDVLQWHKWTGVSIVFVSSGIYWYRNAAWYRAPVAKAGAVLTMLCLVAAGHFGATLTHGDNFVLAPVTNTDAVVVSLDQAKIFDNVIQPIFKNKCIGCHNPDKVKGGLILTDSASVVKGGRTGKLFVPGNPKLSLLLQRVHMPAEEKKHMPPAGKEQLTSDEITLLSLWVKGNTAFSEKVTNLPPDDSLKMMASALFAPLDNMNEKFDFPAADEDVVKKLNNDYRDVSPLAEGSPALSVNLFSRANYSVQKLEELNRVKTQIVFLNLNKMPVTDNDLKVIGQFENLRKLDLNFTDITGQGLKEIASLKYLRSLSVSGTKMNYTDLQKLIPAFKSLKTISVWYTDLSVPEIASLQRANKDIQFIAGFKDDGSNPLKLNNPQVGNSSPIFSDVLALQLKHPIKGVEIRFTMDGTEPDSIHSPLFNNETILKEATSIKAKAFKTGWFGSDVVSFDFYKNSYTPDSVNLLLPLNSVHLADGANTFFDKKLGTFNANSPAWANNWAGFRDNEMAFVSEFKNPVLLSSVALHTMVEPETGIFPPAEIEIWGGPSRSQMKLIKTTVPESLTIKSQPVLRAYGCTFKPQSISCLKIIARPFKKLPSWSKKKGEQGLLLIDEVFIN